MSGVKQRRRSSASVQRGGRQLSPTSMQPVKAPDSEDDSEMSPCPSPLRQVEGGYRVDPFTIYPIQASDGVRYMADYYIQIWAPQQAEAFSFGQSKNALISLVLPQAFQDAMLFHATIAMTRAAWLLRKGTSPNHDKSLLKHRGMALKMLRGIFTASQVESSDALLLTVSTLLTMNYILNEPEPFQVHLQALSNMISNRDTRSELDNFVKGRVMAFAALASFMYAQQPRYATRVNEPGHRISTLTYPSHPFSPDLCSVITILPDGFGELALGRHLSVELISFLSRLTDTMIYLNLPATDRATARLPKMTMQRAIYDLQCLLALPLTIFEAQLAHGLVAFCFAVYNTIGGSAVAFDRSLRVISEEFNAYPEPPKARWQQRCLLWCAIIIDGAWTHEASPMERPSFVMERLLLDCREMRCGNEVEAIMKQFFWSEALKQRWKTCWVSAMARMNT